MTASAPNVLSLNLVARYRVGHDPLGWRIEIGDKAAVRPDTFGRVKYFMYEEGVDPTAYIRDRDLIRALIEATFATHERRSVFGNPSSERRRHALEAICEAANDIWHEGPAAVSQWIGRDH